jgi:hypothetical protein
MIKQTLSAICNPETRDHLELQGQALVNDRAGAIREMIRVA